MEKGEIAEKLLKYHGKHEGVTISVGSVRQLGNVAKETGIPLNELLAYAREQLHELVDELYAPKKKED